MNYLWWIWWLFTLTLLFLADMAYWILGTILLGWVAKTGLSRRHRQDTLVRHRLFQERFYQERLRSERDRQNQFLEE
jgi:hypothetical protein